MIFEIGKKYKFDLRTYMLESKKFHCEYYMEHIENNIFTVTEENKVSDSVVKLESGYYLNVAWCIEVKYELNPMNVKCKDKEILFVGLVEDTSNGSSIAVYREDEKLCIKPFAEYMDYIKEI